MSSGSPATSLYRVGRAALTLSVLCLAFVVGHDLLDIGRGHLTGARDAAFLSLILLCATVAAVRAGVSHNRFAWAALAAGMLAWLAGFALYLFPGAHPAWYVDIAWFAGYPCFFAATGMLVLGRLTRWIRPLTLDGAAGAACAAALAAAITRPTGDGGDLFTAPAYGYPIVDTLLLAFVLTLLALSGARSSNAWLTLTAGVIVLTASDTYYALVLTAGDYTPRGLADVGWAITVFTMGWAAWRTAGSTEVKRLDSARTFVPLSATVVGVLVLLAGAITRIDPWALGFATLGLTLSTVRTLLTFSQLRALASARRASMTDDLTGLANRRCLWRELERRLTPPGQAQFAFLLIDLDGFKELNDSLGHDAGDTVLQEIARRLRGGVPAEVTVGRLGGDEFALIVPDVDEVQARVVARDVRAALARPVSLHGIHIHTGASVGIALAPQHGRTPGDILRRADAAMYEAKRGLVGESVFSGAAEADALDRLRLAGDLRRALREREIVAHYQPVVRMSTGQVVAVEALARWQHPERGLLGPDAFLPALELTNLGPEFTQVVLEQAVMQAVQWRRSGLPLPVAVNLTALDLRDSSLPARVQRVLEMLGGRPEDLMLEITESGLLMDPDRTGAIVQSLRDLGVLVALDDFGTGYSSLTHLLRIKVDRLKIDRGFVGRMEEDGAAAAIVEGTIRMAHALGLEVVGEGVENDAMWAHLLSLGCDAAQGYFLSRPLPAALVTRRVHELHAGTLTPATAA